MFAAPPHSRANPSTGAQDEDSLAVRANRLDLLERMANDLAHEIKNPLHSLVINLAVLKRRIARCGAEESDDMMRYANVLEEELERVNRRTELLLSLSRPDRGAESGTLDGLVSELLELIELEAGHRSVAVQFEPADEAMSIRVPRNPARQAILNLVLEVLDGASAGDTLVLHTERDGDCVRLVIRCTGPAPAGNSGGSPNGIVEGGADTSRLSIARALCEASGGRVERYMEGGGTGGGSNGDAPTILLSFPLAGI